MYYHGDMEIDLGSQVQDQVTGFFGIVTGHCRYITGCNQYLVQPKVKSNGDFVDSRWFDEDRLTATEGPKLTLPVKVAGPDKPAPRK